MDSNLLTQCKWSKISNAVGNHSSLSYHKECIQDADILKATVDNSASRIDVMASSSVAQSCQQHPEFTSAEDFFKILDLLITDVASLQALLPETLHQLHLVPTYKKRRLILL